jgi:hypothetical protein
MKLNKEVLRKIIKEEINTFFEAEAGAAQGGDKTPAPAAEKEKDVAKVEDRMDTYLSTVLDKISSEKEFAQLLTSFLNRAAQHPSIKKNMVRRTLLTLTKQLT